MRFIYSKAFLFFSLSIVILVFFLILQVKGWLDPIRNGVLKLPRPIISLVKNVTGPIKNFFGTVYQLRKITEENANLQSKVIALQQSLVQEDQILRENEALRKELGFIKISKSQLVSCTVLSENSFGFSNSLVIDCGSEVGVALGDAVVSQGYLVGKVVYSGKSYSTVLLSVAEEFLADAKISQTGVTGIVKGSFGSGLVLDQVPQSALLEKGWLVVTAGINSQIPKNILVGEVGETISPSSDLFKKAVLISPIDFHNLEFVFVVKG